jgi:hypothetical protein
MAWLNAALRVGSARGTGSIRPGRAVHRIDDDDDADDADDDHDERE